MFMTKLCVRTLVVLSLVTGFGDVALAHTRVHIFIRAFIPKVHPGNPGYVRPVTDNPSVFVIPNLAVSANVCNPTDVTSCFTSDNRLFSDDPQASARAATEFVLVISGNSVTVEKADGREFHRTGATHKANCQTGADLVLSQTASTTSMHFENPAIANGMVQIVVDGRASNLLVPISPDIQYGGSFIFNTQTKTLKFLGSTKVFPAYEAYAQLNDSPVVSVFQNTPGANTTVCDLIDLGSGFQLRQIDTTVTPQDGVSGKWETTDADKWFFLEINGTSVKWTGRGTANTTLGATLTRQVMPTASGGQVDDRET